MFTFFRKKPATGDAAPAPGDAAGDVDRGVSPPDAGAVRPRSAMDWLNADVGELLFGRKAGAVVATGEAPLGAAVDALREARSETSSDTSGDAVAARPRATPTSASSAEAAAVEARSGWVEKLRSGLRRTGNGIADAFLGATVDDALYEDLEAALLQADAGAAATQYLLDDLERRVTRADVREPAAARRLLARCIEDLLRPLERPLVIGEHAPTVIMVVGVNGAGKTTSVGKLARHLIDAKQKVLLAAADTFRAAAREQLLAWADRAGGEPGDVGQRIEIVSQEGGDPAGVSFDAVVAGKARQCDVVLVDTAGRLATQAHLMEELKKIRRTIAKAQAGAPHEVLLVIDGNTGQNALAQVQAFDAALQLTGLIVTKLDGTAKGGVLAAIALWSQGKDAPIPVYFIGVGEKLADLETFRADEFAAALVG